MTQFEYSVETRPRSKHPETGILLAMGAELAEWLNRKAADGWRLVAVREDAYGASEFFFEREAPKWKPSEAERAANFSKFC